MKEMFAYAVFAALWSGMIALLAISVFAPGVLDNRANDTRLAAQVDDQDLAAHVGDEGHVDERVGSRQAAAR